MMIFSPAATTDTRAASRSRSSRWSSSSRFARTLWSTTTASWRMPNSWQTLVATGVEAVAVTAHTVGEPRRRSASGSPA